MDVSIIIINYRTPELVVDCIKSIREKTVGIRYEIIVVDNNSQDHSIEVFQRELDNEIKVIASECNLGFGKANNLGAKYATGKYLFLLNSDTVLINNAVQILYQFIEQDDKIAVVGGNLYTTELKPSSSFANTFDDIDSVKKQSRWGVILSDTIKRMARDRFCSLEKREYLQYKNIFNFSDEPIKVAYIFGTDMMIRSEVLQRVGGFDPDFFMYAEEEELAWRITCNKYESWNVPKAQIIHYDGATVKKNDEFSGRQFKMRLTGRFTYYKKRFGQTGVDEYYYYRKLSFDRTIRLGKMFRRKKLVELNTIQKACLNEVYEKIIDKTGDGYGRSK